MNGIYPVQVIALDEIAQQALDLAELSHFEETVKTDIGTLPQKLVSGYRQILVLSALQSDALETLFEALAETEEPVLVIPGSYRESEALKTLILARVRVVLAPSDSLTSVSLSQALRLLEALFYGNDPEGEVIVEHEDIYTVMPAGTVTELHESEGSDLSLATLRICNDPQGYRNVAGAYLLYSVGEEYPLTEVVEAMDAVESRLPENAALIFGTRNRNEGGGGVGIVCLLSRRYNFMSDVSERMEQGETYLEKVSVLVDAFAAGEVDEQEAEYLAGIHQLAFRDVGNVYNFAYTQPQATVALIERLHDSDRDLESKVEMLADAVHTEAVDVTIAEGLVRIYGLPLEYVLEALRLKREGKMPLHDIGLSESVKSRFPDLVVAKSEDTVVLLGRDEPKQESSGIFSVDIDGLRRHKENDVEWLVSKKIAPEEIERFIREYLHS